VEKYGFLWINKCVSRKKDPIIKATEKD